MNNTILGIDPGKQGALVFLGKEVKHYKMPLKDGKVDVGKVQSLIIFHNPSFVAIEQQYIMSRQRGAMATGENYGRLTATLDLCGVKFKEVQSRDWQKHFGLYGTGKRGKVKKQLHIEKCEELGYHVPPKSTRDGSSAHDGIADAYLVALYGKKLNERKKKK